MDGELTTTTTNQTTFNVNVYFVVPKNYEDERQCDEKMQEAFKVSYYFVFFFPVQSVFLIKKIISKMRTLLIALEMLRLGHNTRMDYRKEMLEIQTREKRCLCF